MIIYIIIFIIAFLISFSISIYLKKNKTCQEKQNLINQLQKENQDLKNKLIIFEKKINSILSC